MKLIPTVCMSRAWRTHQRGQAGRLGLPWLAGEQSMRSGMAASAPSTCTCRSWSQRRRNSLGCGCAEKDDPLSPRGRGAMLRGGYPQPRSRVDRKVQCFDRPGRGLGQTHLSRPTAHPRRGLDRFLMPDSVQVALHTAPATPPVVARPGLTAAEAARRLVESGPNELETGGHFRQLRSGLGLLANPLVLILLAASVVSGIVGETLSAAIIVTIVFLSVGLDFFQTFRSEQAANRLQGLVALTARVWRDGALTDIPLREVVPGDVLELHAGDLLPADAKLTSAVTLSVDQAALTGESLPVEK